MKSWPQTLHLRQQNRESGHAHSAALSIPCNACGMHVWCMSALAVWKGGRGNVVRSICSHCLIRCGPASSAVGSKCLQVQARGAICVTVRCCKTTTSMCHMHAVSHGGWHAPVHAAQAKRPFNCFAQLHLQIDTQQIMSQAQQCRGLPEIVQCATDCGTELKSGSGWTASLWSPGEQSSTV